ncbi:MAG: hypothetical protein RM368_37065 [Nostoc sp. DedSLP03]|nr:hypothetical protein [Nostoc sp. DedSLP03]MDZ7970477.1 hypothetical protein [Nostoc sp. DedSLP03]
MKIIVNALRCACKLHPKGLPQAIAQCTAKILMLQTDHQNFPRADNIMYD